MDGAATVTPVAVACVRHLADEVERHVEAVLGWQVVDVHGPWVRPAAVLVDGGVEVSAAGVPVVLLVQPGTSPGEAATRALGLGAAAVLSWPQDRGRLAEVVAGVRDAGTGRTRSALVVAGGSGGVGTTTVALALAGLRAWAGRSTLAVVTGDAPIPAIPVVGDDALDGPGVWAAAAPVPGTPNLRAVSRGVAAASEPPPVEAPDDVTVVLDVGVAPAAADVLVVRRDRAGREAIALTPAGALVVVDDGPVSERDVLRGAGGRVVAVVPRWARVARAGADRRVPAGLPASWLQPLEGFVDDRDR